MVTPGKSKNNDKKIQKRKGLILCIGLASVVVFIAYLIKGFAGLTYLYQNFSSRIFKLDSASNVVDPLYIKSNPAGASSGSTSGGRGLAGNNSNTGIPGNNASTVPASDPNSNLEDFLKLKDPSATWIVDRGENGLVNSMMGGIIPDVGLDKQTGLVFAREIAPLLGARGTQIVETQTDTKDTPSSRTFFYDQIYDGLKVYGGYISVFSRNSDGAVYMVNSGVKDLGSVNLADKLTVERVRSILLSHYNSPGSREADATVEKIKPDKVVFMVRPGFSELAWIAIVYTRDPELRHLEVVVSAVDGRILNEVNLLFH